MNKPILCFIHEITFLGSLYLDLLLTTKEIGNVVFCMNQDKKNFEINTK